LNSFKDLPSFRQVWDGVALRRAVAVAQLLFVIVSAYAGALAIGSAVAWRIEANTPAHASVSAPDRTAGPEETTGGRANYSAIFQRNLFGSEPIDAGGPASAPAATRDTDVLLRGTAEFDGQGFAVFEAKDDGRQDVFAVGDVVFDGPKLVGVRSREAILLRGGRRITVGIVDPETDGGGNGGTNVAAATGAGGIRRLDDGRYLVDRREVEHSIENMSTVITQMRAVPYLRDGENMGFRVFNIRSGSVFERMGIQNGDVIQSVNGTELTDPSRALALLDDIQTTDEIRIDLLRKNSPQTFTYSVR
jgi:general secretion pathway protein C